MRKQGVKAVVLLGRRHRLRQFAEIAGPAAEGTTATFGPDQRNRPEAKDVVAKFRAKKFEPESFTLYSYAASGHGSGPEKAKSLDPKKMAEVMRLRHGLQDRHR